MNYFSFNGRSSKDYGLLISEKNIYSAPQRDVELVSVPGRNGDVLIDHGRYCNVDVSYTVSFRGVKEKAAALRQWLTGYVGYGTLVDSYQPDYFRLGVFSSKLDISELVSNVGQAQLTFNCKPYRYRWDGLSVITISQSGTAVVNPESVPSEPHITIYGNGEITLHINRESYNIKDVQERVSIDTELMHAYKGGTLMNGKIGFVEFPLLSPGENVIQWTGNVTKVEITPNWRSL